MHFRAKYSASLHKALNCKIFSGVPSGVEMHWLLTFAFLYAYQVGEALAEKKLQRTALAFLSYSGERNFFPAVPFECELRIANAFDFRPLAATLGGWGSGGRGLRPIGANLRKKLPKTDKKSKAEQGILVAPRRTMVS